MLKKSSLIAVALITTLSLSGCSIEFLPPRIDLEDLILIKAVGVDKSIKNPDNINVTVISKKRGEPRNVKSGGETDKKEAIVLSNEAPTALKAEGEFQTYSDKQMFWGHVDYLLVGEDAAKEGIEKYIDYFARDHEFRESVKVYIIRGTTAEEFIKQSSTGEYFMPDRLDAIGKNSKLLTGSQELPLLEFLQ